MIPYQLVQIEPLGTERILPAIVIGYEIPETFPFPSPVREKFPPWQWLILQQAGGVAMRYPQVFGCILRLAGNADRTPNLATLDRALRAMAEDPDVDFLRDRYPVLHRMVLTSGEDYDARALLALDRFLAGFVRLPTAASGFEAFIRFVSCDLLDHFAGWRLLEHQEDLDGLRSIYAIDDGIVCMEEGLDGLELGDRAGLASEHLDTLAAWAARVGLAGPPSAFLLWENSD